jgi:hypothetical protein
VGDAVSVESGRILWRGVYRTADEVDRLIIQFETTEDWFRPQALDFASQLRAAVAQLNPQELAA